MIIPHVVVISLGARIPLPATLAMMVNLLFVAAQHDGSIARVNFKQEEKDGLFGWKEGDYERARAVMIAQGFLTHDENGQYTSMRCKPWLEMMEDEKMVNGLMAAVWQGSDVLKDLPPAPRIRLRTVK